MPGIDPLAPWRRLLALPADSRAKTLSVAVLVSAAAALLVSGASVLLDARIEANRAAEARARFEAMLSALPGLEDVLASAGADTLETVVVDLASGTEAAGTEAADFDMQAAASDPATSRALEAEADIAGLRRVPLEAEIHLLRDGRELRLVVLPVWGAGYQSTIRAMLALEGDLNTVAALVVTEQGETPGLGARIAEPGWAALWPGKKLADDSGEIRLSVRQGGSTSAYEVDGITGATRTGNGVSAMIRFWMGPEGYGPLLENLRDGEL